MTETPGPGVSFCHSKIKMPETRGASRFLGHVTSLPQRGVPLFGRYSPTDDLSAAIPGEVFLSGGCVGRQLLGQEVAQVRSGRIFRGATSRASCSRKLDISLLNRLPSLLSSTLAQTLSRTW